MIGSILCLAFVRATVASQESGCDALLLPARAALEVQPDAKGRLALHEVLARFEVVSDWTLLMNEETRRLVSRTTFTTNAPLRAEPEQVVTVVEAVLANANYVWTLTRAEPPRLLAVHSLDTNARTTARESVVHVPVERIARFVDHPALFVETVVSLPNTDVRTLSNSLRGMIVDPNALQIVPMGAGNELLLQGSGRSIADLVEVLQLVDAFSAPGAAKVAPTGRAPRMLRAEDEVAKLPGGDETSMTMLELVLGFADATGQVVLLSDETTRLLEYRRLGLERAVSVPGPEFQALVEELLLEAKFVLTELLEEPALFTVRSLDTTARTSSRQYARYVDASSLEACGARPATMFWTVLDLPHCDVRTLSNSLRGLVVDPNTLQIIPVGNSSSMVLQGFGRRLARTCAMLELADAAAAARIATEALAAPQGGDKK